MTKTRPRFARNLRRPNAGELTRPLPPILVGQIDDESQPLVEHRNAAGRYVELSTALPLAQPAVTRAQVEADAATRAAVRAGKASPQRKADRVAEAQQTLERTASELETVEDLLGETASALLVESIPHVRAAIAIADERRETLIDEAERKLADAVELLETAGLVAAESAWLGTLAHEGEVAPFGGRGGRASAPRLGRR